MHSVSTEEFMQGRPNSLSMGSKLGTAAVPALCWESGTAGLTELGCKQQMNWSADPEHVLVRVFINLSGQ